MIAEIARYRFTSPPGTRFSIRSPLVGLLASLQGIAFAYGRNMYSVSRAGYYPRWLSLTWGVPGAVIAAVIAALIFVGFLLNPTYLPAIIAIVVVYAVILIGFAVFFRHRLVLSPEEEYALSGGTHGDPQAEGYDAMEKEVFDEKP